MTRLADRTPLHRLARGTILAFALVAAIGGSASAAPETKSAAAAGRDTARVVLAAPSPGPSTGCWAAECPGDPVPWKLVLPICYAHEGSQYLPQCQDIYP
jgi:hypothetical protein